MRPGLYSLDHHFSQSIKYPNTSVNKHRYFLLFLLFFIIFPIILLLDVKMTIALDHGPFIAVVVKKSIKNSMIYTSFSNNRSCG